MVGNEVGMGYEVIRSKRCWLKKLERKVGLFWVVTWEVEEVVIAEQSECRLGESRVGIGWLWVGEA